MSSCLQKTIPHMKLHDQQDKIPASEHAQKVLQMIQKTSCMLPTQHGNLKEAKTPSMNSVICMTSLLVLSLRYFFLVLPTRQDIVCQQLLNWSIFCCSTQMFLPHPASCCFICLTANLATVFCRIYQLEYEKIPKLLKNMQNSFTLKTSKPKSFMLLRIPLLQQQKKFCARFFQS
jgi:hypothetical protein